MGEKCMCHFNGYELKDKKSRMSIGKTPFMYGAAGDGVTDDTAAIKRCIAEQGKAVLNGGVFLISEDINGCIEVGNGAMIKLKNTVTLSSVEAGMYQIFDGIPRIQKGDVFPEWFAGDDADKINNAIKACTTGKIILNGEYNIGNKTINFTGKNNVALIGNGMATVSHSSLNAVFFGSLSDVVINENDSNNEIANIIFDYTGSAPYDGNAQHATIFAKAISRSCVKNCRTRNRQQFLYMRNTVNFNVKDCALDGASFTGTLGYDCIYCDNVGAQNMSLKISNIVAHMGCCPERYRRGIYMIGDNRDAMILNCEFDGCNEAIRIYTSGDSPLAYDVTIENLISDLFEADAIHIENGKEGQINIRGCWLSGKYVEAPVIAINAINAGGVNVSENQIQQNIGGDCTGVRFSGCEGCICNNNVFYDSKRCVMVENSCTGVNVIGNVFYAKTRTDLEYGVKLDGSKHCIASLNSGYSGTDSKYDFGAVCVNSQNCVLTNNACGQVAEVNEYSNT